ncbi:MAG: 2-C-methyl-D-erythritol 2,4-cyclodiphosphate synthase [Candidatus Dasytiphilus stammeri]
MRIGHGFDAHAFAGQGPLILGGVKIPYIKGLIAHSDGDVLLHAVIDSILGAAALGDIGNLFPNIQDYKDADSRNLLRTSWQSVLNRGYQLGNLDVTIIAQVPRISPHISQMRFNLAKDLSCPLDKINIKATTTDKLGFTGREEGIACEAIALIFKKTFKRKNA